MNTTYTVIVNDETVKTTDDLETAIRTWDSATYLIAGGVTGGIEVKTFDGDVQVRDGWILHAEKIDGGTRVYLNPNLQEATA